MPFGKMPMEVEADDTVLGQEDGARVGDVVVSPAGAMVGQAT